MYLSWQDFKKEIYSLLNFPSFFNLSIEWNMGFSLTCFCLIQIMTGIILTLFFNVGLENCLISKSFMMKEMELGWVLSYYHLVTPSFMFFCMFFHIFKSLYNLMYSYSVMWVSGFFILLLFILVSFTGYGLVGGSLGFWAIVVFMGLVEFIFGESFSFLLFSDFGAISDLILYKVFSYHFILSLSVGVFIFFHLYMVHVLGSSVGIYSIFMDFFSFIISSYFKDLFLQILLLLGYFLGSGFFLEYFFSLENFIELCIYVVPEEMNSEWYLSLVFILLSSVNSKSLGIFFTFIILFFLGMLFYSGNLFGEKFFSKGNIFSMIFSNWLLIIFTLSKYGASFFITSESLFILLVLLNYFMVYFFKDKKLFLDFVKC